MKISSDHLFGTVAQPRTRDREIPNFAEIAFFWPFSL